MKITREYLRRIIKEELERTLNEEVEQAQDEGDIVLGRKLVELEKKYIPSNVQSDIFNLAFNSATGFASKMRDGDDLMRFIAPHVAKQFAPYFKEVINLIGQYPVLKNPAKGERYAFASKQKAYQEEKNQKL
jgi:hypothetical protein